MEKLCYINPEWKIKGNSYWLGDASELLSPGETLKKIEVEGKYYVIKPYTLSNNHIDVEKVGELSSIKDTFTNELLITNILRDSLSKNNILIPLVNNYVDYGKYGRYGLIAFKFYDNKSLDKNKLNEDDLVSIIKIIIISLIIFNDVNFSHNNLTIENIILDKKKAEIIHGDHKFITNYIPLISNFSVSTCDKEKVKNRDIHTLFLSMMIKNNFKSIIEQNEGLKSMWESLWKPEDLEIINDMIVENKRTIDIKNIAKVYGVDIENMYRLMG
jgi:hypothetical protein